MIFRDSLGKLRSLKRGTGVLLAVGVLAACDDSKPITDLSAPTIHEVERSDELVAMPEPDDAVELESDAPPLNRGALLDTIASSESLAQAREEFLDRARAILDAEIRRRPNDLAELRASRIPWDSRYDTLGESIRERFALAKSDAHLTTQVGRELPVLAVAYRISGEQVFLDRIVAQLTEMADWSPLQRRGWSLASTPNAPADLDDGNWLATGRGIQAITDTLEWLPPDSISPGLRSRLERLLESELASVVSDWEESRPWYVRADAAHSNQWILPMEGVVRAAVFLGPDSHRDALNLGIEGLLKSLDRQGDKGEFVEGLYYSTASVDSLLSAARAAASVGDTRLAEHPFLKNYPVWLAHHAQPGGFVINAFNTAAASRNALPYYAEVFSNLAFSLESPAALWIAQTRTGYGSGVYGLLARALPENLAEEPPLFANYPMATRVNWRSSWDDDTATGVWVRGGHPSDFHDHMDRGHVNFIVGNQPILIEAGSPDNDTPGLLSHYRGVAGHNVLQVGEMDLESVTWNQQVERFGQAVGQKRAAPISVERLDADGGALTVDVSDSTPGARRWVRRVEWNADQMRVIDEVELVRPDIVVFRWHLGITPDQRADVDGTTLQADAFSIRIEADQPITTALEAMPDATLRWSKQDPSTHQCLVVRSDERVRTFRMETRIDARRE